MKIFILFYLVHLIFARPTEVEEANEEEPSYELTEAEIRIVNGSKANVGEVPYIASLYYIEKGSDSQFCGASIIHPEWLITAAHCVDELLKKDRTGKVIVGEVNLLKTNSKSRQEVNIATFVNHPQWNKETLEHDIGLIKLAKPLQITAHVNTIALPPKDYIVEKAKAKASVWGIIDAQTKEKSENLQTIEIPIMKNKDCKDMYFKSLLPTNICAGSRRVTCGGDSGGPLAIPINDQLILIGITSWGTDDPCDQTPGVFTRVSAYIDWIEQVTGQKFS